ncbi:hypothetical protein KIW84_057077 [Lathyrus oleraceus]|uniref:DUF4283 domain-containing protein n=1 Tax=Pisum sativum TaxID=3888 RepID=A0A9D4X389_PEA|nr:hypothetical protein KIW84_057077 [Pisum sativum]
MSASPGFALANHVKQSKEDDSQPRGNEHIKEGTTGFNASSSTPNVPWKSGVIVKLLRRKIGYKALETQLKQMWVRRGIIIIIYWENGYYLVAFSNEEDKVAALPDGPWFIYDHYLTVKDWSPNFQPESDTIIEVAVWI